MSKLVLHFSGPASAKRFVARVKPSSPERSGRKNGIAEKVKKGELKYKQR
jgi:hypothetical protein